MFSQSHIGKQTNQKKESLCFKTLFKTLSVLVQKGMKSELNLAHFMDLNEALTTTFFNNKQNNVQIKSKQIFPSSKHAKMPFKSNI